MKKILLLILLFTNTIYAQTSRVQQDLNNFVPGELIVKLKDNVDTKVYYAKSGKATSIFNIGQLLGISDKVKSSTMMFHQKSIEASIVNKQKMKAVYAAKSATNPNNGYTPKEPLTMKNVFVLKTSDQQENILQLIQQIKDDPNVEYAEPNYIYSIDNFEVGDVITEEEASKISKSNSSSTIEVNDPLYSSQSNITSTNIDDVWEQYTTGDGSQVIAILDTGVDYTHPDLEANTWINTVELNGVEGYDDDGNGYIDDIRGWDFINLDNEPLDDNMHGTHVAGIAGAVGNNGIGIAGAAWNVKLMPIKVFQSTGSGNLVDIAYGVEYAYTNGATIINMSFTSANQSALLLSTLENAYPTSVLVAAAGNQATGIGPICPGCKPFFPAAYNFVLGIQDLRDTGSDYSNYDPDPIGTAYGFLYNYEIVAPGTNIMSTIPNGGYATLTGTSMATPLIAGAIALYNQVNPNDSKELMFGNLINSDPITPPTSSNTNSSSVDYVNIFAALTVEPVPKLAVVNAVWGDSSNEQGTEGYFEPGETIDIFPLIKNYWGPSEDVRVGIEWYPFEDQTKATITQDEIQIGSITAYASLLNMSESLKVTISDNVANDVLIRFLVKTWSGPNQENLSSSRIFTLKVTNAIIWTEYITEDTTFTNDQEYIFQNSMVVNEGAVLTIEAGTTISFSDNSKIFLCQTCGIFGNGTADNPIILKPEQNYWSGIEFANNNASMNLIDGGETIQIGNYLGSNTFSSFDDVYNSTLYSKAKFTYTQFKGVQEGYPWNQYYNQFNGPIIFEDCLFTEISGACSGNANQYFAQGIILNRVNITNSNFGARYCLQAMLKNYSNVLMKDVNISDITNSTSPYGYNFSDGMLRITDSYNEENYKLPFYALQIGLNMPSIVVQNRVDPYLPIYGSATYNVPGTYNYPSQIWVGSSDENVVENWFLDYSTYPSVIGQIDYSNLPSGPSEGAHGIVWKILIDENQFQGINTIMEPVGVGEHEIKVYFNRAMNTSIDPQISYGVTIPYNQKIISETGTWSEDGKIYTVNHNINVGAADGINRFRVQGAQDLDNFEIPIEDRRFSFLLQSAGSASAGWYATPGLGKIALTWEAPSAEEIDDALGYNMYRYQVDADGVESTPVKLNETLIVEDTDESTTGVYYSDFDVVEGEIYFYKYNILRTSFETTDFSSVVSSTPLTSTLGDSNGDFTVDVLDLVHDVDYILGNNPTPFIFLAGDVNADNAINVLDIVGTVDIILNPSDATDSSIGSSDIQFYPSNSIGNATFSWEGNDLFVEADHNIGGLQLAFSNDFEYTVSSELATIEKLDYIQDDTKIVMLFSFNNTVIADGKTKLLTRLDETKDLNIELAVVGTTTGAKLNATLNNGTLSTIDAPFQNKNLQFLNLFPNPTEGIVHLEYYLPKQMDGATAKVYDMVGRLVWVQSIERSEGIQQANLNLNTLKKGNYVVIIIAGNNRGEQFVTNKILILK